MKMIYITGDKHADFTNIYYFCENYKTSKKDTLIILGDAGINYYANKIDEVVKNILLEEPITFFCIHGNHEERPENLKDYKTKIFHKGIVYYEEKYPNILFAKDGEIYEFNKNKVPVIGGAYSVDKDYRLQYGYNWYESEQPSEKTKEKVLKMINKHQDIDIILSHTCPYKYIPREMFISGINQSTVDFSTEKFLDKVEEKVNYKYWYCGHYHTDKKIDKIRFMFNDIDELKSTSNNY